MGDAEPGGGGANGGQVARTSPAQKGGLVRFAVQTQGVSGDQAFSFFWCGKGRRRYKRESLSQKRNKCMAGFQAGGGAASPTGVCCFSPLPRVECSRAAYADIFHKSLVRDALNVKKIGVYLI